MCTTCSHAVVVGSGGSVVVLVVLVVLVVVVDVVDVDVVDVVVAPPASVVDDGTTVLAVLVEDGEAALVDAAPSADWIRSLHAAVATNVTRTSIAVVGRFIP
jgi:hypothetical protein